VHLRSRSKCHRRRSVARRLKRAFIIMTTFVGSRRVLLLLSILFSFFLVAVTLLSIASMPPRPARYAARSLPQQLSVIVLACRGGAPERLANAASLCESARGESLSCSLFQECVDGSELLRNKTLRCELGAEEDVQMEGQLPGKVAAAWTYVRALRQAQRLVSPPAGHDETPRHVLFLEDDAVLEPGFWEETQRALSQVPDTWDVLSLYDRPTLYTSPTLTDAYLHFWSDAPLRVYPWASYAYNVAEVLSAKGLAVLLDNLPVRLTTRGPRGQGRDKWMGLLNEEYKLKIYSTQRPLVRHDQFPSHLHASTGQGLITLQDCYL